MSPDPMSADSTGKILVAGIGNIFLGDDAFGSELARRLLTRPWPCSVRVEDFGIRGFDLTFALMDGYDLVILLDATSRGGNPGTLYTIEPDLSELDRLTPGAATVETHGMNPMRVLAVARTMGAEFRQLYLIGCEPSPETIDPDGPGYMGLSDPVRGALDEAVNIVETLVAQSTGRSLKWEKPQESSAEWC
jgi:hydrogenase maturation protease